MSGTGNTHLSPHPPTSPPPQPLRSGSSRPLVLRLEQGVTLLASAMVLPLSATHGALRAGARARRSHRRRPGAARGSPRQRARARTWTAALLAGIHLSRRLASPSGARVLGGLEITNLTDNKVLVDGRPSAGASRRIRLWRHRADHQELDLLLLVERPPILPALDLRPRPSHAFLGEADVHGIVGESLGCLGASGRSSRRWRTPAAIALIHGLTGTGKELAARLSIGSPDARRFVPYNAARRFPWPGRFDSLREPSGPPLTPGCPSVPVSVGEARCGTLLLDDGEPPIEAQARLLRTLEGEYTRQGEAKP